MLFSLTGKAQMTLENLYTGQGKFVLTQIATNQFKYFLFDPPTNQFKLYNLNHSLYMTVNIPLTYNVSSSQYYVSFVTKSLFDCDSTNIEYAVMFLGDGSPTYPTPYFAVYRTSGTLFQKIDTVRYFNYSTGLQYGTYYNTVPIINTPAGAKLILSKPTGQAAVYSLCSVLPTNIVKNETPFDEIGNPFPNPTNNQITLPYSLPKNETSGKLVIVNSLGQTIKEFDVDSNFSSLILNKNELPTGTYFYQVKSGQTNSVAKKFIMTN